MVGTLKKPKVSNSSSSVKFLYSYGGKILPRYPDGKLRYVGGETRVLSVDRASISYSELMVKLCELCGFSVSLRCQLPSEDLDALVSIKSDEDLINVMEEYDLASKEKSSPLKLKAFLYPLKPIKKISPPLSGVSSPVAGPPSSTTSPVSGFASNQSVNVVRFVNPHHQHLHNQISSSSPMGFEATPNFHPQPPPPPSHRYYYSCISPHQGSPRQVYLVHNGNHWQ